MMGPNLPRAHYGPKLGAPIKIVERRELALFILLMCCKRNTLILIF
jgi:hypothetical protein